MLSILFAQTATAPPGAEVVPALNEYTTIIQAWQGLGIGLAVMFVLGLVVILGIGIVFYIFRPRTASQYNATETMRQELVKALADERKEKSELEAEKRAQEDRFIESLTAISDASNRIADNGKQANAIIQAINTRDQETGETHKKLATAITTIVEEGSKPLRDMAKIINDINVRTTEWDEIIAVIPTLKSKLEALEQDAERHSTKPMPPVDVNLHLMEATPT